MKIGLIILSAALLISVLIYTLFNRDSDRVILTFVTAMTIGALGFITKESISNKVERFSKEFPVAVFFSAPDYKPLNIKLPYYYDLAMCLQAIKEEDLPKHKETVDINFGQNTYYDALQFLIIAELFKRFSNGWHVVAKQTQMPGGKSLSWQSHESPGKEVSLTHVLSRLGQNYFVRLGAGNNVSEGLGGKALFPPNTEISLNTNDSYKTVISLSTRYISINITLSKSASFVGIGEYSTLLGLTSNRQPVNLGDNHKYANAVYLLEIQAEQNFLLNGHPEMKKYRNWANSIIELLDNTFNYEAIRTEHLRQFQLFGSDAIRAI